MMFLMRGSKIIFWRWENSLFIAELTFNKILNSICLIITNLCFVVVPHPHALVSYLMMFQLTCNTRVITNTPMVTPILRSHAPIIDFIPIESKLHDKNCCTSSSVPKLRKLPILGIPFKSFPRIPRKKSKAKALHSIWGLSIHDSVKDASRVYRYKRVPALKIGVMGKDSMYKYLSWWGTTSTIMA